MRRGRVPMRSMLMGQPAPVQGRPRAGLPIIDTTGTDQGTATDAANDHSSPQERMLAAAEVAAIMGRTLRTLANWERAEVLKPIRIRGRRMYRLSDVETLMFGVNTNQS